MSDVVMEMLKDCKDASLRDEILNAVKFLTNVYATGKVSTEEILNDFRETCEVALANIYPDWEERRIREAADDWARRILRVAGATTIFSRKARKHSGAIYAPF